MIRLAIAMALVLVSAGAYAQFNGCSPGICPQTLFGHNGFGPVGGGGGVASPTGKILRIDGTSHILRLDGVSKICRLGGC